MWHIVYCFTMKKNSTNIRSNLHKAVCIGLIIIFSGSVFTAGAMQTDGCGMQCCCQTGTTHGQPMAEKLMLSQMGCCSNVPLSPCDLQSSLPYELPDIMLASCCIDLPNSGMATGMLTDTSVFGQNLFGGLTAQAPAPRINSRPIYLQNSSFLI